MYCNIPLMKKFIIKITDFPGVRIAIIWVNAIVCMIWAGIYSIKAAPGCQKLSPSYQFKGLNFDSKNIREKPCRTTLTWLSLIPAYTSLESMADVVSKSEVVLLSLSQKYKDSPACRTGNFLCLSFFTGILTLCADREALMEVQSGS